MSDYHQYVTMLANRKLAAWAFAVGERPRLPEDESLRPPHRGMLPDVDFDRAIADPSYRPLLSRIADFLRGGLRRSAARPDAAAELGATLTAVLGERPAAAYIGEGETGDAAIRPAEAAKTERSRAA